MGEGNPALTPGLRRPSVVCCGGEMKAGLSNNSEFNTATSPLMRAPCLLSAHIHTTGGRGAGGEGGGVMLGGEDGGDECS